MLENLPFWPHLTVNQQQYLVRSAGFREYRKGQQLYGSSDECLGMIVVESGVIRTYIVSPEGREITLFKLGQGESCVLSVACVLSEIRFETQIMAAEDARLRIVPTVVFDRLFRENVYVREFAYETATRRFSAVMHVMQQMIFSGLDQRLAGFLLEKYEESGSPEIVMTQEEIAGEINSAREVVARAIRQFAKDELVSTGRGRIRILDLRGLRELAEDKGR